MASFFKRIASKSGSNRADHAESMDDAKAFGMNNAKSFDHGLLGNSFLAHLEAHLVNN